jgi:biotin carboxyl carrier protein
MADLSTDRVIVPGTAPADPGAPEIDGRQQRNGSPPAAPVDPRTVRVRLAAVSRLADEPAVRVAPAGPQVPAGPDPKGDDPRDEGAEPAVLVEGTPVAATLLPRGGGRHVLAVRQAGASTRTPVVLERAVAGEDGITRREVLVDGFRFEVELEPERIAALRERASRARAGTGRTGPLEIKAVIPGRVVSLSVSPGDAVTAGQQLLTIEAMKMQNELRATRDGTVSKVAVAAGANIEVGDLLVVIS